MIYTQESLLSTLVGCCFNQYIRKSRQQKNFMLPLFELNNPKLKNSICSTQPHNIQKFGYNRGTATQEQTNLQQLNTTTTKFSVPFVIALIRLDKCLKHKTKSCDHSNLNS